MTATKILLTVSLVLGATSAALAQSAYTSGSAASREMAGYPSPYGGGGGLYAYAPRYGSPHVTVRPDSEAFGNHRRSYR